MKTLRRGVLLFLCIAGALQASPAADPQIGLTPASFVFNVPEGGPNPTPGVLKITNTGSGQLFWFASVDQTWISLAQPGQSQTSGQLSPNSSVNVDVLINVGPLLAATYNATITVKGPDMSAVITKTAPVTMQVSAIPRMEATPGSFTFAAPQNGANPSAQPLTVRNTGGGTLNWTAAVNQSWLKVDGLNTVNGSLSPAGSHDIQVSVITGSLPPATHTGKVTLSAAGVPNIEVNVSFTINQNPAIGLTPTSLTFDAPQGGPNPAAKQFTVKNDGGGTLVWSVTDDATWLTLNPTGGSLASGQSQVVTATADVLVPANLVEATYLATVSVAGTNQATGLPVSNSPQTLGVTLNVNSIPTIGLNPSSLSFTLATDVVQSAPAAVSITNTGSGTLNWTLGGGASWVSASPSGGSLSTLQSQPLQVSVIPFGLAPGVYTTTLQISASPASNSPRTISVELTVTASSLPTSAPAGQCGLLGLDVLALLVLLRSLKSRGGSSCSR